MYPTAMKIKVNLKVKPVTSNIHIGVHLNAYTKGIIPDVSKFITEAPEDGNTYARKDGQWVDVSEALNVETIETFEGSGLNVAYDENTRTYTLSVRKKDITELELPTILENDTTYYVLDLHTNTFLDGGTSFSSGDNEYVELNQYAKILSGGQANTSFDYILKTTNSEGVYNE